MAAHNQIPGATDEKAGRAGPSGSVVFAQLTVPAGSAGACEKKSARAGYTEPEYVSEELPLTGARLPEAKSPATGRNRNHTVHSHDEIKTGINQNVYRTYREQVISTFRDTRQRDFRRPLKIRRSIGQYSETISVRVTPDGHVFI